LGQPQRGPQACGEVIGLIGPIGPIGPIGVFQ
jgi:hypothetical protein